jgi:myosin heavy subunit
VYQEQSKSPNPFNLRDTPPHTYAIAANSYRKLFENNRNQAIVISGESGAGKTENAKIAMKFLTSLSESGSEVVVDPTERIEEKIMACNPILESFGNAKTVRNDNSSRFGKYVRIIVNSESRRIKGAAINNYLLEKSRVVGPGPQERNYHVFYSLLKGATKEQLEVPKCY